MKYLFLNQFAFENIDTSSNQNEIIRTFTSLAYLAKDIEELNSNLIFDNKLSLLLNYIKLIEDRAIRIFLMAKIRNPKPFCSDSFDEYFEDENIVLGNCVVDDTDIDILENFLACAMFLNSPIITPKNICENRHFLNETINIKCDKESVKLKNYFLEESKNILKDIEIYLESLDIEPLEYCHRKFKNSNLNFSKIEEGYGFDSLKTVQQINEFLNGFDNFSKMSWEEIRNSDGLEYKKYNKPKNKKIKGWFREGLYKNRDIYKFRITQKYRCFGYREEDKFFVLRFEIGHEISDNG